MPPPWAAPGSGCPSLATMSVPAVALTQVRDRVDSALRAFACRQRTVLLSAGDELLPGIEAMTGLLSGGKRLRPAFCYWGWRAAGGADCPEIIAAAASLELLQASALIHDDVMDGSDTRRGLPSVHKRFEALHASEGWPGAPEAFGMGAAILLGDLTLSWSGEMFDSSGLTEHQLAVGRRVYDLMRTEVMCGQYLDMLEQAKGNGNVESAL